MYRRRETRSPIPIFDQGHYHLLVLMGPIWVLPCALGGMPMMSDASISMFIRNITCCSGTHPPAGQGSPQWTLTYLTQGYPPQQLHFHFYPRISIL
ncbi:hypothetical protein BD779DRAFT_179293 [Infundibulicybe gibba]|nr:hypothetical protein BD779DRAFT_179293 [Infundibulicybe gibba]